MRPLEIAIPILLAVHLLWPRQRPFWIRFLPVLALVVMLFHLWIEGYRWTPLTIAGALLALGGMVGALSRPRAVVAAPDAG